MDTIREEFIKLILELVEVPDDEREEEILERLDQISPDPNYSDYIYHSYEFYNDDEVLDVDSLAEKVFSYKPVLL